MAQPPKPSFFRKAGLAAWAMFTLILVFCVLLLANELMKSGKSPLDISKIERRAAVTEQGPETSSQLREAPVYVIGANGAALVPETRRIPLGDVAVDNCRAALDALKQPAADPANISVLPPSTEYNALYLMPGGELVIDFSSRGLQADLKKSAGAEALMVYGVVNTLTQDSFKGAKGDKAQSVRFLIDGAAPRESFPAHLDLSRPIAPDPQWILKPGAAQ
ncbi:MAG: GerMN domain-containing protein [Candidatus Hydrogenedentes bacterium]|nr:GerMN domain-containing protein [Candidatus Hydrogenedentota bacterium]